jgi:hypothetical protein
MTTPGWLNNLASLIGFGFVSLSSVAALSFALFKFFGERWLSSKFDERMATFKHEQQKELERIKFEINSLMDRRLKLYQREFDILPEAWEKLFRAFALTESVLSKIKTHPNLDKMQHPQLDNFLGKTDLEDWQKDEIRSCVDKTGLYAEYSNLKQISKASDACFDSVMLLKTKGLFIENDLKDEFDAASKLISDSLFEFRMNLQLKLPYDNRLHDTLDKFPKEAPSLIEKLESKLRQRLWNAEGKPQ